MVGFFFDQDSLGNEIDVEDGFIGFRYLKDQKWHYGWISVDTHWNHEWLTVNSFAYHTIPGMPIICTYDTSNYILPEPEYFPLPDTNSIWSVATIKQTVFEETYKYGIPGDTSILSENYRMISLSDDSVFYPDSSIYYCAVRESNKKWYFVEQNSTQEKLLYDFSINTGDTVQIDNPWSNGVNELKVDTVDSVFIYNEFRKRILLNSLSANTFDAWIEGIGSIYGLFYSGGDFNNENFQLICFEHLDMLWYINSPNGACFIKDPLSSGSIKIESPEFTIYPNPFHDKLTIVATEHTCGPVKVEIFTIHGVKEFSEAFNLQNKKDIPLNTSLTSGVYFLRIQSNIESVVYKVVKQ